MREHTKEVTWASLQPGQKIHGWRQGDTTSMADATVKSANSTYVMLMVFDKHEKSIYSEGSLFEVDLTPEEFRARWKSGAQAVINALQVTILSYEAGYHEMANGWLDGDPFEMAAQLARMDIKLVGVCRDISEKIAMFSNDILDVGLVVEEPERDRWWVHYRDADIKDTIAWWKGESTNRIRPRDFEI